MPRAETAQSTRIFRGSPIGVDIPPFFEASAIARGRIRDTSMPFGFDIEGRLREARVNTDPHTLIAFLQDDPAFQERVDKFRLHQAIRLAAVPLYSPTEQPQLSGLEAKFIERGLFGDGNTPGTFNDPDGIGLGLALVGMALFRGRLQDAVTMIHTGFKGKGLDIARRLPSMRQRDHLMIKLFAEGFEALSIKQLRRVNATLGALIDAGNQSLSEGARGFRARLLGHIQRESLNLRTIYYRDVGGEIRMVYSVPQVARLEDLAALQAPDSSAFGMHEIAQANGIPAFTQQLRNGHRFMAERMCIGIEPLTRTVIERGKYIPLPR